MAERPLISVVIPVYNVEAYLDACMESVVAQTYDNLQIILVDDGAKDSSGAICDIWAQKDSRIQVIHQTNRGLSGARNTGLEAMSGEYVMFVDSDDILSPRLCQILLDALSDGGDIAVCDAAHIFPDRAEPFGESTGVERFFSTDAICKMWYQTAFLPSAWGKLYRATLFSNRRFTEGRLFEDIDIMHEVFYDADTIVYTHAPLYGYVHREGSITTNRFSKRDLDILTIAEKILTFVREKPALQKAAQAYAVTAGLRVWLNAPDTEDFHQAKENAKELVDRFGRQVLADPLIRKKNRLALRLYFTCKPLMRVCYKFVNRWK